MGCSDLESHFTVANSLSHSNDPLLESKHHYDQCEFFSSLLSYQSILIRQNLDRMVQLISKENIDD